MAAMTMEASSPQAPSISFNSSPSGRPEDQATSPELRKQIADDLIAMSMSQVVAPTSMGVDVISGLADTSKRCSNLFGDLSNGNTSSSTISFISGSSHSTDMPHGTRKSLERDFDVGDASDALLDGSVSVATLPRAPMAPATAPRTSRTASSTIAFAPDNAGFMSPVVAPERVSSQPRGSYPRHQSPGAYQDLEMLDAEDEATMHKLSPSHRKAVKANNPTPTKLWGHRPTSLSQASPGTLLRGHYDDDSIAPASPPRNKIRGANARIVLERDANDDIMKSPAAIKVDDVIFGLSGGARSAGSGRSLLADLVEDDERSRKLVAMKHGSNVLFGSEDQQPYAAQTVYKNPLTSSPYRPKKLHDAAQDDQELDATIPAGVPINPRQHVADTVAAVVEPVKQTPTTTHTMSRTAGTNMLDSDLFSPFSRFVNAALSATSPVVPSTSPDLAAAAAKASLPGPRQSGRLSRYENGRERRRPTRYEDAVSSADGSSDDEYAWRDGSFYRGEGDVGGASPGTAPVSPSSSALAEEEAVYEYAQRAGMYGVPSRYPGGEYEHQYEEEDGYAEQGYDYEMDSKLGGRGPRKSKGKGTSTRDQNDGYGGKVRPVQRSLSVPEKLPSAVSKKRATTAKQAGAAGRVYTARQVSLGAPGTSPIPLAAALDPELIRHQTTCHRCTSSHPENVRVYCVACPACWCAACARRAIQMFGLTTFDDGCPKCKRLCCCVPFAGNVVAATKMTSALAQALNSSAKGGPGGKKLTKQPSDVVSHDKGINEGTHFCVLPLHCRNCRLRPATSAIGVEPVMAPDADDAAGSKRRRADSEQLPGLDIIPDYVPATALALGEGGVGGSQQRLEYQYLCCEKDAALIVNDFLAGGDQRRQRIQIRISTEGGMRETDAPAKVSGLEPQPARKRSRPNDPGDAADPLWDEPAHSTSTSMLVAMRGRKEEGASGRGKKASR